jgi:hypothetical protein
MAAVHAGLGEVPRCDADDLRRITETVGQVLPGRVLTREELATEIAARLGAPELAERIRSGWGVMLKPAAAGGLLCFGRTVSAT